MYKLIECKTASLSWELITTIINNQDLIKNKEILNFFNINIYYNYILENEYTINKITINNITFYMYEKNNYMGEYIDSDGYITTLHKQESKWYVYN